MKIVGCVVVMLLAVAAFLFWPVQRAANAFSVAETNHDREGVCRHAVEVAEAWAGLGFAGKSQEWRKKVEVDCALDALERSMGG